MPFTVQFTLASAVSRLFPAHETMLDHAILERDPETLQYDGNISCSDEKRGDDYPIDETGVA